MKKIFKTILIEGAGLIGPALAARLATNAEKIVVIEKRTRQDCQKTYGRSVNLALGSKGWDMMDTLGYTEQIQKIIVPMKGRMIHDLFDTTKRNEQSYGFYQGKQQTLDAISRLGFSMLLIELAEKNPNIEIKFNTACTSLNAETGELCLSNGEVWNTNDFDVVIASDGINSQIRKSLCEQGKIKAKRTDLNYAYVEIEQPALAGGNYPMPANHLHIWPRGNSGQMFASLPNPDGTLTGAFYAPVEGENSFEAINTFGAEKFFKQHFPTLFTYSQDYMDQYFSKRPSQLAEIRCENWYYKNIVIAGDAAHAVTPFLGQGMNFGMMMANRLYELLIHEPTVEAAFKKFEGYIPEANLLAEWSQKNFVEMSTTNSPKMQLRKDIEAKLELKFDAFASFHSKVCFRNISFCEIAKQLEAEDAIFEEVYGLPNIETTWSTTLWPQVTQMMVPAAALS